MISAAKARGSYLRVHFKVCMNITKASQKKFYYYWWKQGTWGLLSVRLPTQFSETFSVILWDIDLKVVYEFVLTATRIQVKSYVSYCPRQKISFLNFSLSSFVILTRNLICECNTDKVRLLSRFYYWRSCAIHNYVTIELLSVFDQTWHRCYPW